MLLDIAISSIVKGSVLLALVLLFVQYSKSDTAAVKHNKLAAALIVLILVPMLEMAPKLALHVLPPNTDTALETAAQWLPLSPTVALVIFCIYACVALILLLRILLDYIALQNQLKKASACGVDLLPEVIQRQLSELGQQVSFWQLESLHSPITVGAFRTKVIFPHRFLNQSDHVVSVALQHELAHIRRNDWAIQLVSRIVVALFWFNPLVHICARGLHNQAEIAADDEVVLGGAEAPSYAGVLLDYARQQNANRQAKTPSPLWTAMLGPGLVERVHALTQRTPRRYYDGFGLSESVIVFLVLLLPFTVLKAVPGVEPKQLVSWQDTIELDESPYGTVFFEPPLLPEIVEPRKPQFPPSIETLQWRLELTAMKVAHKVTVKGPEPTTLGKQLLVAAKPTISRSGFMPAVSVMPMYPRRAVQRNVEGFVDVIFDIQLDGSVENARVLRSEPSRVFDRAALSAIRKSRYAPHQVNGGAVKVQDVENRYVFRLTDSKQDSKPNEKPASKSSEVLIAQGVRYEYL